MDIDISDILADVSRLPPSSVSQTGRPYDLNSSAHTDQQLLVRAWISERSSPSLLPYPGALMDRVMTRIRDQVVRIEDLTSGMGATDPYSHTTTKGSNPNTNLILSILQTDLSRTQFIVRSYLRQRLAKITKNAVYWLKYHAEQSNGSEQPMNALLSPAETAFLRSHQALLSEFYDSSFLASFPANLRRLDDSTGGTNMVEGPDGGVGVVVRCLASAWDNTTDLDRDDGLADEKADIELRMSRDEIWVVRWRDVRAGVVKGDLELL